MFIVQPLGRYIIPKKTIVTILICALNQDPTVFHEPFKFDPDRFLPENKPEYLSDFTFGAGPRNCLGKQAIYSNAEGIRLNSSINIISIMDTNIVVKTIVNH